MIVYYESESKRKMNKNLFLPILLIILFSGCHTIRPPSTADPDLLSLLPKSNHSIQLVLDKSYRNYVSTDRGNALADPQTYRIGEALAPLTESYFKTVFPSVSVVSDFPPQRQSVNGDFIVYPHIASFQNELRANSRRPIDGHPGLEEIKLK